MENTTQSPIPEIKEKLNKLVAELGGSGWRPEDDHFLIFRAIPVVAGQDGTPTPAEATEENVDTFLEMPLRRVQNNLELEEMWDKMRTDTKVLKKPKEAKQAQEMLKNLLDKAGKLVTLVKGNSQVTCIKQIFDGSRLSNYQYWIKKGYVEFTPSVVVCE